MQKSSLLRFFSVNSLPLGNRNFLCPVTTPAPRKSVLEDSRRMLEQVLVFGAFCANIEAHLLLMKCPIHEWPNMWKLSPAILCKFASADSNTTECTRDFAKARLLRSHHRASTPRVQPKNQGRIACRLILPHAVGRLRTDHREVRYCLVEQDCCDSLQIDE